MDIPVPTDLQPNNDSSRDVPEASTQNAPSGRPTAQSTTTGAPPPTKAEAADLEDDQSKKINELISSKQYYLGIKEKHTHQILTLGATSKKSKKSKKKTVKKSEQKPKKSSGNNKTMVQVGVLVVLILGFVVALDAGFVDIGVKLPFDLIK
jgi:hypothetical protein